MKKEKQSLKLSLASILALSTCLNATSLEELLKDVDVNTELRYRYDSFRDKFTANKNSIKEANSPQIHNYKAIINLKTLIADNFRANLGLKYLSTDGGYGYRDDSRGYLGNSSSTKDNLELREYYISYDLAVHDAFFIFGKQQLNTIWTDNSTDGLVGTGFKFIKESDKISLVGFLIDSYGLDEQEGEYFVLSKDSPFNNNLYGGAILASFQPLGGNFNSALWGAYIPNSFGLYALDLNYALNVKNDINWGFNAQYLGNQSYAKLDKYDFDNGKFLAMQGNLEFYNWDASLGGLFYGDKDKNSLVVLEDLGNVIIAGEEIFYTQGSRLFGDRGSNKFAFMTLGYTFDEVLRIGGDFVYGGTKILDKGFDKMELVGRIAYAYSPKLEFSSFYSYVNAKGAGQNDTQEKQKNVRIQVEYKF